MDTDFEQVDGGVSQEGQPEADAILEDQQAAASDDQAAGQADLAQQADGLARQEDAVKNGLDGLRAQLSRLESRFDRGGQDAASIKDIRRQISTLETRLEDIGDLRDTVDLVLQRQMEPEEWERYQQGRKAKQERRQVEQERDAYKAQVEASTVKLGGQGGPSATVDPGQVEQLAKDLDEACRDAGYDPSDPQFQARVKAAVPKLAGLSPTEVFAHVNRALVRFGREDRERVQQAAQRTQTRQAVQPARTQAASSPSRYATLEEAEAAFARDEISPTEMRELQRKLAYSR